MSEGFVEFVDEVCGLYFRSILLRNKGDVVTQHVHDYDHATFVGNGCAVAFIGDKCLGEFWGGQAVPVKAGYEHRFVALVPDTRLACVHSVESAESIKAKGLDMVDSVRKAG